MRGLLIIDIQRDYFPGGAMPLVGAVAADSEGNTYVTGSSAFVTKLDPAGGVVFAKMFGPPQGGAYSYGSSIAVDPSGNVWVGGASLTCIHGTVQL